MKTDITIVNAVLGSIQKCADEFIQQLDQNEVEFCAENGFGELNDQFDANEMLLRIVSCHFSSVAKLGFNNEMHADLFNLIMDKIECDCARYMKDC